MNIKKPPLRSSDLPRRPKDIIPSDLNKHFNEHYRRTYKGQSLEEFNQAVKFIPIETREKISIAWEDLRQEGWLPRGLDKQGDIDWHRRSTGVPFDN